jgi:hypothetical protein
MAESFSKDFKALRKDLFTEGKPDNDLFGILAKGEFPTYCELNSNACVFLVHVPELRRFTAEAKESLGELAWQTARETIKAQQLTSPPNRLVVGVKGELWYDPILIGKFVPDPKEIGEGIESKNSGLENMKLFYPFFDAERDSNADGGPRKL